MSIINKILKGFLMLYWMAEHQDNQDFINELESQLVNNKKFHSDGYYDSKTKLKSDLKKAKMKKNKHMALDFSGIVFPLILTGIYMASDGISLEEIKETMEISYYMALNGAIAGGGAAFTINTMKLGMGLMGAIGGNIKDSGALVDQELAVKKSRFVQDFFKENEFVSNLDKDDILSVGSCYAFQKRQAQEKRNRVTPYIYKKTMQLSDNSPFIKNIHKLSNGRNFLGMNETDFHEGVFNFIDNILEHPVNNVVEDVFRQHKRLKDKSGSKSSFNAEVFKTLEEAFDEVYKEKQIEEFQNILTEYVIKSSQDTSYFKRNKNAMNDYISTFKDIEINIANNELSYFLDDVERQIYKLTKGNKVNCQKFEDRNKDLRNKFNQTHRNDILERVENKFLKIMCENALDYNKTLISKNKAYAGKNRETLPDKRVEKIIQRIQEDGIEKDNKPKEIKKKRTLKSFFKK